MRRIYIKKYWFTFGQQHLLLYLVPPFDQNPAAFIVYSLKVLRIIYVTDDVQASDINIFYMKKKIIDHNKILTNQGHFLVWGLELGTSATEVRHLNHLATRVLLKVLKVFTT